MNAAMAIFIFFLSTCVYMSIAFVWSYLDLAGLSATLPLFGTFFL